MKDGKINYIVAYKLDGITRSIRDLKERRIIDRPHLQLSFKPLFNFTDKEVKDALHKLNQEAEESAEEFYKIGKKKEEKEYRSII